VNTFIVDLKNKPSELAKVTEAIAQKGIDINGFSAAACGDTGTLAMVTSDEASTHRALTEGAWTFRAIEVVETSLVDQPGALAEVARRLAKAGVNIEAAFPTGMTGNNVHVAFVTNDPTKAKETLRELVGVSHH